MDFGKVPSEQLNTIDLDLPCVPEQNLTILKGERTSSPKIYAPAAIQKWADKAIGKDFLFCPKVPQTISHYSSFVNIEDKTNSFLAGISAFKEHLGPVFLQVSDRFSPKRKENLFKYLESLPKDVQFF